MKNKKKPCNCNKGYTIILVKPYTFQCNQCKIYFDKNMKKVDIEKIIKTSRF